MAGEGQTVIAPGTTRAKAKELRRELAEDMTSSFKLMEDDMEKLIRKASKEEWSVVKLFREIDIMLGVEDG